MTDTLHRLAATIAERRHKPAADSYVAALLAKGLPHVARKMGEEAVETVVAALSGDLRAMIGESADLLFHLLVLLDKRGVLLDDVLDELERREGVSGHAEKAARPADPPPAAAPAPRPPVLPETAPVLALGQSPVPRKRIRKG